MGPHQGDTEVVNLLEQGLDPFVLGDPCANLREQVLGDVDGACLALVLEGEVMGGVQRAAVMAAAGGADAAGAGEDERSGEEGGVGGQLLEAGVELASDEGGVVGDAQEASAVAMGECMWLDLRKTGRQGEMRQSGVAGGGRRVNGCGLKPCSDTPPQLATKNPFLTAVLPPPASAIFAEGPVPYRLDRHAPAHVRL